MKNEFPVVFDIPLKCGTKGRGILVSSILFRAVVVIEIIDSFVLSVF